MSAHVHHGGNGGLLAGREPVAASHEIRVQGPPDPHTLTPGSFIYLWAPGVPPGHPERLLARVVHVTREVITARDLNGHVEGNYQVGQVYPAGLRWSWELAAPPERPVLPLGQAVVVDRAAMDLAERARWLFGEPGSTVRVTAKDGNSYVGVPSCYVVDTEQGRVHWVLIDGPTDARGPIRYKLRFEDICGVIEGGGR